MKRIRIFLASSITDLKFDRIEIGNFFRQLNDIYIENGIYFDLVMCEDYDNGVALEGKQSEFDRLLCDSELVFFVFFNKVGEYTRHEFEVALESYKTSKKPKIVTYFKYVNSVEEAAEDVRGFMSMLDTELRHYYNIYSEIDTLKLGMFMQIKLMRLDNSELTVEDGKLMHGKTQIAETKNIPMFECNEKLRQLREKLADADGKFRAAKVAFLKSRSDDDYLAFSDAATEKEQAQKALRDLEAAVLSAAEKMYETTTDGRVLSEKQKQAYRHMEKGEWELALAILDKDEIMSDLSHNQRLGDGIRERIAVNVGELLQRIEVLRAQGLDKETIAEIISLYNTVYGVTINHNLDLKPIAEYAVFLHDDISYTEDALKISEKLTYLYADPDRNVPLEDKARLLFLRGKICVNLKRYDEAIEILKEGMKFADELYAKEGDRIAVLCGGMRNVTANALFYLGRKEEAHPFYESAKDYYEKAYAYDSKANKGYLAMIYDNYGGNIEQFEDRLNEALEYHLKAAKLYIEVIEDDEIYKRSLARCYHNTALCYKRFEDFDRSEEYLLESIRIREEIRQNNPESVEKDLSSTYYSLGLLYMKNKVNLEKAVEAFNASKKIRVLLRKRSIIYAEEMRSTFMALIYADDGVFTQEQKTAYRAEYIDILLGLPELTEMERRDLCEDGIWLSEDLYNAGNYERAFEIMLRAIDIYIAEGTDEWYVSITGYRMGIFRSLCAKLGKLDIYENYAEKIKKKLPSLSNEI